MLKGCGVTGKPKGRGFVTCAKCGAYEQKTGNCQKLCSACIQDRCTYNTVGVKIIICKVCGGSVTQTSTFQKFCPEHAKEGRYLSKIERGVIKKPGVGTGHGRDKGLTHQAWTTGIRAYRSRVKPQCEECGEGKNLQVHHIDENRLNNTDENLKTLCAKCHRAKHIRRGHKLSEEHKAKLKDAWTRREVRSVKHTEETKQKLRDRFIGKHLSPEHIQKLTEAQRRRRAKEDK